LPDKGPRGLVTVHDGDTLATALRAMNENMINSVPILDSGGRVLGIVDNEDIVHYFLDQMQEIEEFVTMSTSSTSSINEALEGVTLREMVDFSHGDPLLTGDAKTSLMSLIKFFASGLCHRCVVYTPDGISICSQMDVIHFLAKKLSENKDLMSTIDNAYLSEWLRNRSTSYETILINQRQCVYHAFQLMNEKSVSAVGVVNDDGKLVGNLSLSDVSSLSLAMISEFNLSVKEYLDKFSPASLFPVTIEISATTVLDAISIISEIGVHRLWIVDSRLVEFVPEAIVTITDLLRILTKI